MFHPIGNSYTDIVTTRNLPLNNISRHQRHLIVTHQIVEEPDEGKLSHLVLETIVGGDAGDEFNPTAVMINLS